jgi:hypothetical protein
MKRLKTTTASQMPPKPVSIDATIKDLLDMETNMIETFKTPGMFFWRVLLMDRIHHILTINSGALDNAKSRIQAWRDKMIEYDENSQAILVDKVKILPIGATKEDAKPEKICKMKDGYQWEEYENIIYNFFQEKVKIYV